jgi:tetratricopeptide (TPR) repeat protein
VERQQEDLFAEVPALMAKLSEHPDDVDVLREIAELFSQAQEWQKAVLFWGKVIELSPDDINALYHRGTALMHMASFHDAIADFERIVSLDPGAYYALFYLGFISKYGLGEKDRAKEYFQRALELEPQDQFLIETLREEIATL